MKDDKWFNKQIADYMMGDEMVQVFLKRIYTHGRVDQNEADVKIIIGLPFELIGGAGADAKLDILTRIRAAGPEDK